MLNYRLKQQFSANLAQRSKGWRANSICYKHNFLFDNRVPDNWQIHAGIF